MTSLERRLTALERAQDETGRFGCEIACNSGPLRRGFRAEA